ncbi:exo-alpha-sialidase [Geminisphaera colitermitum]|uniref:exo-alpha-sialidase n=1 Tax=Geminisphaera colitermitum TaxID=1148786 RepID=UPI001E358E9F|nr:sialidase family protein [Geminisphaera colitermitum]
MEGSRQLVWYGRRSTDEGAKWSEPFLVKNDGNAESKPTNGGHGFQFSDGRMVIPGRKSFLTSDDGGVSWTTRGTAETVETKVAPLPGADGTDRLYLIARKSRNYRIYGAFGEKLAEEGDHRNVFPSSGRNPGLALYAARRAGDPNILLMSGIRSPKDRIFSITYSTDEGRSWSSEKRIDETGWYSDIGVTKDGTIIVAYTVNFSANLKIARFNLPWMMEK